MEGPERASEYGIEGSGVHCWLSYSALFVCHCGSSYIRMGPSANAHAHRYMTRSRTAAGSLTWDDGSGGGSCKGTVNDNSIMGGVEVGFSPAAAAAAAAASTHHRHTVTVVDGRTADRDGGGLGATVWTITRFSARFVADVAVFVVFCAVAVVVVDKAGWFATRSE